MEILPSEVDRCVQLMLNGLRISIISNASSFTLNKMYASKHCSFSTEEEKNPNSHVIITLIVIGDSFVFR